MTYAQAIELAAIGIDLDDLVSDRFPIEQSAQALEHAVSRTGDKTVIVVSRS
jgi:L-iditol 2-dehydrogenase